MKRLPSTSIWILSLCAILCAAVLLRMYQGSLVEAPSAFFFLWPFLPYAAACVLIRRKLIAPAAIGAAVALAIDLLVHRAVLSAPDGPTALLNFFLAPLWSTVIVLAACLSALVLFTLLSRPVAPKPASRASGPLHRIDMSPLSGHSISA